MNTEALQSPEVALAFANLERARADLARSELAHRAHEKVLRSLARRLGVGLREARRQQPDADYQPAQAAKWEYRRALDRFRSVALIAALTRVVDTDCRQAVA